MTQSDEERADEIDGIFRAASAAATDRFDLWARIVNGVAAQTLVEVGVYRGAFAEATLRACSAIETYYMIDPWRHLEDWNKPANQTNEKFAEIRQQALDRTEFAAEKRVVLEGRTTDMAARLPVEGLDFAYVDGDHTLRGITIDLIRIWPTLRPGALLAGDDFVHSAWHHELNFEPTLVFPMAVYFAEAVDATIYGLPFEQFAIIKGAESGGHFQFIDLTNSYNSTELSDALKISTGKLLAGIGKSALRKIGLS